MPKVVDRENYRKELLTKCFDVLGARGINSMTMKELAKAVDVSTGSFITTFRVSPKSLKLLSTILFMTCFLLQRERLQRALMLVLMKYSTG